MSMLKSHSLTLTLSHSLNVSLSHSFTLTLSLTHSLTLHLLNKFCFHVYAQKLLSHSHTLSISHSLFIDENVNAFFDIISITLPCYFRCHRAGSQLKTLSHSKKVVAAFLVCFQVFKYTGVNIFSWEPALWTLMSQDRVLMRSQKIHCNFRL